MAKTERKYENSAIGSWAGYIYQGLCGLYHGLKLIAENRDKYKGYKLYLDSYEDFAIMNDDDKLVSLHQCKNEKSVTDYTSEFAKMKRKLVFLAGLCSDDCKLYFHTNKDIVVAEGIILYPFTGTQNFCEPGNLLSLIRNQVDSLLQKNDSTKEKIVCSLVALIDEKVLEVHQRYIEKTNKEALHEIAKHKNAAVDFQTIIDRLFAEEDVFAYDRDSYIIRIKYKLMSDLNETFNDMEEDELSEEQKNHVLFLIDRLGMMSVDEMEAFLKRIHPIDNITDRSIDNYGSVSSPEKVQSLFGLISDLEQLDDDLSWNTDRGKETPTSLNSSFKTAKLCKKIVGNKTNNDSLYEYDWLVGNVQDTVENIGQYLPVISDVDDKTKDERSIFETKKVGLVCKKDRINGNY